VETKKIRALIVDDSILFRTVLSKLVNEDKSIEVVGTAGDAYDARDKILELRPDVLTLDIEMPKMNGIDFLKKLIPQYPIPVVVVSSLPINAFEALDAGAVEYIKKPVVQGQGDLKNFAVELREKIKIASSARVGQISKVTQPSVSSNSFNQIQQNRNTIIAIGASTGGTDAIQAVIKNLPKETPPIIITQHMPPKFTSMFAQRLDKNSLMEVREAQDGDRLTVGLVLIAAGEYHLRLAKDAIGYYVKSEQGERVSGHCPSVDVLFDSVAEVGKANAIGVILTGMGSDGAKGLLKMRKAGAYTIGQDKESCVVYGMPMVAFNIGAVITQTSLEKIPNAIYKQLQGKKSE